MPAKHLGQTYHTLKQLAATKLRYALCSTVDYINCAVFIKSTRLTDFLKMKGHDLANT